MYVNVNIKLKSGRELVGVTTTTELDMDKPTFSVKNRRNVVRIPISNIEYVIEMPTSDSRSSFIYSEPKLAYSEDDHFSDTLKNMFGRPLEESDDDGVSEEASEEATMPVSTAKSKSPKEAMQEIIDNGPPIGVVRNDYGNIGAIITSGVPESVENAEKLAHSVKSGVDSDDIDYFIDGMDSDTYEALSKSICGMFDGGMSTDKITEVTKLTELEIDSILKRCGRLEGKDE